MQDGLSELDVSPETGGTTNKFLYFAADYSLTFKICYFSTAETITALEYSGTGDFLATGDRNGRITVLKLDMDAKIQVNL